MNPMTQMNLFDDPIREGREPGTTAEQLGKWMLYKVNAEGELKWKDPIAQIPDEFVIEIDNGNACIRDDVKRAFRKARKGTVDYDDRNRVWRRKAA